MALPTPSTPGYTSFPTIWGPRTCCTCVAQWLPVYARKLGVSTDALRVTQLTGGASASAGTHSRGGAIDLLVTNREWVRVAREMGAAAWVRGPGFSTPHIHMVLNGCPHNGPARYQITALANGRNGLANNGPDDGPGPRQLRTWQAGIAWAGGGDEDEMTPAEKQKLDYIYRAMQPTGQIKKHLGDVHRTLSPKGRTRTMIEQVHRTLSPGGYVRTVVADLRVGRAGKWHDGPGGRMLREIRNRVVVGG